MADREAGYDEEKETQQIVQTNISGYNIDLNNLPGKVRVLLVKRGELDAPFVLPPNMPGSKLAELRKRHKERVDLERNKPMVTAVGDYVEVGTKGSAYPIVEIDENYVYFEKPIKKTGETKRFRVPVGKARIVKPTQVNPNPEDDDENLEE